MTKKYKKRNFLSIISILLMATMILLSGQNANAEPKQYKLGDIPLSAEEYQKHLKKTSKDMATIETALPPAYDARDDGFVTSPKNQGSCGSCWAFACVGALEAHLLKAGMAVTDPDLAEQQQLSCNTSMWGCEGGNSNALLYWDDKGPLSETNFPYTANDQTPCTENGQLGYLVADYHTVSVSTTAFKESLSTYGPSYWRYVVYDDFYTFWNSYNPGKVYVNQGSVYKGGHAVLLIGWDDEKNAFLCKNSWGSGGPNGDGTFWIAYDGHANSLGFGMANFSVTSLTCDFNSDCDDGIACNGVETCVNGVCQPGTPISCPDDGEFCNGSELCDETIGGCGHTAPPCGSGEICEEETDSCVPETCYNGICEEGEDCINCSADCISGSGGGDCSNCFKGKCDGNCHPNKEDETCTDCAPSYCCGDGVCNGEENSDNCPLDCGAPPEPETNCGDGIDNDGDGQIDCYDSDCTGTADCPVTAEICNDGIDNDWDGQIDCDDSDCDGDPDCPIVECLTRKEPCLSNGECCSGRCFRGACK